MKKFSRKEKKLLFGTRKEKFWYRRNRALRFGRVVSRRMGLWRRYIAATAHLFEGLVTINTATGALI